MNKKEIVKSIKEYKKEYKKSDDELIAYEALWRAFSLMDKYNLDCNKFKVMTNFEYHSTIIYQVLPMHHDDARVFLSHIELRKSHNVSLNNLKIGDEVTLRYIHVSDDQIEKDPPPILNNVYTTLVNSTRIDNYYKLLCSVISNKENHINKPIRINIPNLKLFIQRLNDNISSYSRGIKIIK